MKIQCDVCSKKEASVFCTADEAALCDVCDQRVHHANILASKHQRFSLLLPSISHFPVCDICQEKRALLFCQEDRAILCRECDIPLHTANEYTQKHNRFLLTGIKLSTTRIQDTGDYNSGTRIQNTGEYSCDHTKTIKVINDVISGNDDVVPDFNKNYPTPEFTSFTPSNSKKIITHSNNNNNEEQFNSGASSSSNISDYLIETLPGWHFDDFIIDPNNSSTTAAATSFGFSKSGNTNNNGFEVDEDLTSFFDVEQYEKNLASSPYSSSTTQQHQSLENLWVPQAPLAATASSIITFTTSNNNNNNNNNNNKLTTTVNPMIMSRKCRKNDVFTVPQITSSSTKASFKRSRTLW